MISPNELSFLPEDYLERKAQRRTNAICATLFLIVMVAIGSAFSFTEGALRKVEGDHNAIEKEYTEAAKRIEQVTQMQEKQRTMAIQAELTSSLLEKVPRSFLLAEVTNSMPPGVSLLDLMLESKKRQTPTNTQGSKSTFEQKRSESAASRKKSATAAQPQATTYDVSMKITGIANTDVQVAQFISKLNGSSLLKDVNLVISDQFKNGSDGSEMRKFTIEMLVDPQADVASIAEQPKVTAVELKK
jgi:Tfp pilus assembly protein PilN